MRKKADLKRDERMIKKFILKKIDERKEPKKPLRMRYLEIAKPLKKSYSQVRRVFGMMIRAKEIEKKTDWYIDEKTKKWRQNNAYKRFIN